MIRPCVTLRLWPAKEIARKFTQHGLAFSYYLNLHLQGCGFVFSTPEFFVMGRPVERSAPLDSIRNPVIPFDQPDAWYIHGAAGDMGRIWDVLPYHLGFAAFETFESDLRFDPIEALRK